MAPQYRTTLASDPLTEQALLSASGALTLTDTTIPQNTAPGDVIAAALASLADVLGLPEAFYKIPETCVSYITQGGTYPNGLVVSVGVDVYGCIWSDYYGLNNETTVTWVKLFTTQYPVQQIIDDLSTGIKTWIIPLPVAEWSTTPVKYNNYSSFMNKAHGVGVFTTHSSCVDASDIVAAIGPLVLRSRLPALSTGRWVVALADGEGSGNIFAMPSDFNAKPMMVSTGVAVIDPDPAGFVPVLMAASCWDMFMETQATAWCNFDINRNSFPAGYYVNGDTRVPPRITGLSAMHDGFTNVQTVVAIDVANGVIYDIQVPYQPRHVDSNIPGSPLPRSTSPVAIKIAVNNHLLKSESFWGESIRYRGTYTDSRDGTVYRTVLMPDGNWWTIDNFRYNSALSMAPNGDPANVATYGRLYTSDDAAASAPTGCHLPTADEYANLFTLAGGEERTLQYVGGNPSVPIPGYVGRIFWGIVLQLLDSTTTGEGGADRDDFDLLLSYDPLGFDLMPAGYGITTTGTFADFNHGGYASQTFIVCVGGHWHQYWNLSDFALEFLPYLPGYILPNVAGSVRYIVDSGNVPLVDPKNYAQHTLSGMTVKDETRGFATLQMMANSYKAGLIKHY